MTLTRRARFRYLWLLPLALLLGAGAGVATAWPAPVSAPSEPDHGEAPGTSDPRPPERDDPVTIGDGLGGARADLTYGDFLDEIERLEDQAPAPEGVQYMYGLLPSGEIGVVATCIETRVPEANRQPEDGPDATGWECRPQPELAVPGHNVAPNAPSDFWDRVPPEALP